MTAPKPILVAWSGGKDCLMALERLLADPRWSIAGLLVTFDQSSDRVAMHDVRGPVVRVQAQALGLPLIEMPIDWPAPNADYEDSLEQALMAARSSSPQLEHIAFGDLFLADLRAWREASLSRLGWKAEFPLWNESTRHLAAAFTRNGNRAKVVTVDLDQLNGDFCGCEFDDRLIAELPSRVDPCGENGEFHTLCYASPLFDKDLELIRGDTHTRNGRFRCTDFTLA